VLWVQLALLICYLPVIVALLNIRGELSQTLVLSQQYAGVFVLVNSSLNPLLYCWKILEVRQAVVVLNIEKMALFIDLASFRLTGCKKHFHSGTQLLS